MTQGKTTKTPAFTKAIETFEATRASLSLIRENSFDRDGQAPDKRTLEQIAAVVEQLKASELEVVDLYEGELLARLNKQSKFMQLISVPGVSAELIRQFLAGDASDASTIER